VQIRIRNRKNERLPMEYLRLVGFSAKLATTSY
jgi:hypothetical protein